MVVLVVMFTVTALLRPLIPPRETNAVGRSPGDFMKGASRQRVLWRTLADQPFAEAKRLDRPVVLVIGSQWNAAGRYVDKAIFSDNEVAERLNHSFVPVRIDASIEPEWSFGPVPIAIAQAKADPGWMIAVLQPDGKPLVWVAQSTYAFKLDSRTLQSLLTTAQRDMEVSGRKGNAELVDRSRAESEFLLAKIPGGGGDLTTYSSSLLDQLKESHQLSEGGVCHLYPWEWRFLLASGHGLEVQKYLGILATSNAVDWLDGGFFRIYGPGTVRYDKVAVENADLTAALAATASRTGDQYLRQLALRSFDRILELFVHDGRAYGWTLLDAQTMGRSPRHSVRPSLVGRRFQGTEGVFVKSLLGVDPSLDSTMLPHVTDPDDYLRRSDKYEEYFSRWKKLTEDTPIEYGGEGLVDVECGLYSRLSEAARLLDEPGKLEALSGLFTSLQGFKTGPEDVMHTRSPDVNSIAYLGDYTAYAEACLQRYLAEGDLAALDQGRAVLSRAMKIFETDVPGVLGLIPAARATTDTPWIQWPNLVDGARGSVSGELVRLAQQYSCLYREQAFGQQLRQLALTQVSQCARITTQLQIRAGSLAHGMSLALGDRYAAVCGEGAVRTATSLSGLNPGVVVFPALGQVRKDLQAKGPGVYIAVLGDVQGPMSAVEAKAKLEAMP